jgi:hypothetical protein
VIRAPEFASVSCYLSIAIYSPLHCLLYLLKLLRPDQTATQKRRFTERLRKHFDFLQRNRDQSRSEYKSLLDIIPLRGQHTEKSSVATVANGNMNDLWWSTEQQRSIVEVHVLTEDNEILDFPALPNLRVSRRQKVEIGQMFYFVTTTSHPDTKIRRKIRVNKKLHLLSRISRWAA